MTNINYEPFGGAVSGQPFSSIVEQLNREQRAAVSTDAHYVLVLAGAGSGKTKVLTSRLAWLIQTGQCGPTSILAVTFTNKAAKEMLSRIAALLPINPRSMWVGTFHGLCNRLLRMHYRDAGLPQNFQILDSADQLSAIKRLLKTANINTEKFPHKELQRFINGNKESGKRSSAIQTWDQHDTKLVELYQLYDEQCQREGVVDFAELLLRCYELLERNQPLREHYQRRFHHILVDEFQDTNELQYKWLCLLAGGGAGLFAVGDDDQSIYAFRGSNEGNMLAFERDYAKGNIIRLEQNYRSYGHILNSANSLIHNNSNRLGKNLWTAKGEGEFVRVIQLDSEQLEAQWVIEEIKSLRREEGFVNREIAILYRTNAQSRALEHALVTASIPYKVYGGQRFYERQEIKHVLAYLRLVASLNDDTSFLRVVNFPTRGIGNRTLENLGDAAKEIGCSLALAAGAISGRAGVNLQHFLELIQEMSQSAQQISLPELIQLVIEKSGLELFYKGEREGQGRIDNMRELINAAKVFVFEENFEGYKAAEFVQQSAADYVDSAFAPEQVSALTSFLSYASLEAGDNQTQAGEDAVQLMTIHSAKGLEFNAVFLTGLEEGLFPHKNSLWAEYGLEEERRLMYVAITRARQRLYISYAQNRMLYGQLRYAHHSRFLDELPEEALKWLTPKESFVKPFSYGMQRFRADSYNSGYSRATATKIQDNVSISSGTQVGDNIFRIGQTVAHPKFGQGVIIHLSGTGQDASARIYFSQAGEKTLALGVAKLEII